MNSNTGVWVKAELDDDGKIVVKVHAAAEWMPKETVTVGEDITNEIPADLMSCIKSDLNKIINASKVSMLEKAKAAALEMANFKLGKPNGKTLSLDFGGTLKQEGKMS